MAGQGLEGRVFKLFSGRRHEDIAKALGIKKSKVANWSSGRVRPKLEDLIAIADYCEVTLDWLMAGKRPMKRQAADSWRADATAHACSVTDPTPAQEKSMDLLRIQIQHLFDVAEALRDDPALADSYMSQFVRESASLLGSQQQAQGGGQRRSLAADSKSEDVDPES